MKKGRKETSYHKLQVNSLKQAGFTVEAAFVVSFLCFLLAAFLQVVLYLHDVSVMVSCTYEAAQKAAVLKETGQKAKEAYAEELIYELLNEKCLACSEYQAEAHAAGGEVQIRVKGSAGVFGGIGMEVQKQAASINPVDYLRNVKKGERLWKKAEEKAEK